MRYLDDFQVRWRFGLSTLILVLSRILEHSKSVIRPRWSWEQSLEEALYNSL